ncbi:hypothetical protein CKO38_03060 [Rhodospirillum rubrum]|uniref:hypothetical protein n=1 Tax=Rhodospirillum rubrum TaxID=1085 RepID=UPI0019084DD8|nr:hypothetical protein [Rhodospirillum rubrum]MBK1663473.1 hypothetical protein [Rhodospirillum rubrum]MBK1675671.1 hypothetical protein [Rhodospirillum rubrum]
MSDPKKVQAALNTSLKVLDSVVKEQERAVNRILGLAELLIEKSPDQVTAMRLEAIMEACAFQDITGQQIRKVAAFLKHLGTLQGGLEMTAGATSHVNDAQAKAVGGLSQDQVDKLLRGEAL